MLHNRLACDMPARLRVVFTSDHRDAVRRQLLGLAEDDPRITGAALTGSGADGREDRWSDIDLFFGVADQVALDAVLADWSGYLYGELGALHQFDLKVPGAVYRAFLLPSCLEVDLGFTPAKQFGPVGPRFRAVFGEAVQLSPATVPDPGHLIGLAWHHVLHARSCIERHQPWQAEYWISSIRDQTLALACLRFGQPTDYAKGPTPCPSRSLANWRTRWCEALSWRSCVEPFRWRQPGCCLSCLRPMPSRRSAWKDPFASWRT